LFFLSFVEPQEKEAQMPLVEDLLSSESTQKKYARLVQLVEKLRAIGAPRWRIREIFINVSHLIEIGNVTCQKFGLSSVEEIPETINKIVFLYLKNGVKAIRMQSVAIDLAQQYFDEICCEIENNPRSLIINWDRLGTNKNELDGLIMRFAGSKKEFF
jgi:hypothetical protein